jgi:hypothetical protein
MEIECWDAKTGAGPFFGPFFGPAKKGHLVLAFQEKMNLPPAREPAPDLIRGARVTKRKSAV